MIYRHYESLALYSHHLIPARLEVNKFRLSNAGRAAIMYHHV